MKPSFPSQPKLLSVYFWFVPFLCTWFLYLWLGAKSGVCRMSWITCRTAFWAVICWDVFRSSWASASASMSWELSSTSWGIAGTTSCMSTMPFPIYFIPYNILSRWWAKSLCWFRCLNGLIWSISYKRRGTGCLGRYTTSIIWSRLRISTRLKSLRILGRMHIGGRRSGWRMLFISVWGCAHALISLLTYGYNVYRMSTTGGSQRMALS